MGRIVTLAAKKQSLTERVEALEDFKDKTEDAVNTIAELAPIFKTATKLFKTYAPIVVIGLMLSVVSDADKLSKLMDVLITHVAGAI